MVLKKISVEEEYKKNAAELRKEDIAALKEWNEKQPHLPNCSGLSIRYYLSLQGGMDSGERGFKTYHPVGTAQRRSVKETVS